MIKHLERLKQLRKEITDAGMLRKGELAIEIADESYRLAVELVREILTLKQEVQTWKTTKGQ